MPESKRLARKKAAILAGKKKFGGGKGKKGAKKGKKRWVMMLDKVISTYPLGSIAAVQCSVV